MNTKLKANEYEVRKPHSSEFVANTTLKAVNDTNMADHAGSGAKVGTSEFVDNPKTIRNPVKTAGMFVAAPFIALAYVIALPFIGFYNIAKLAFEAYARKRPAIAAKLRNIGLFFASPFIALGYVIALPFVGFYTFSKLAAEAHAKRA